MHALPEWQLGWLAGMLDGEGSIGLVKHKGYATPRVRITSTHPGVIDIMLKMTDIGTYYKDSRNNPKHKARHVWHVAAVSEVYELLFTLLPYLLIKSPQAKLMLEYCKNRITNHITKPIDFYYTKFKKLNLRGPQYTDGGLHE